MAVPKLPSGTRGARTPPAWLNRLMVPLMMKLHRRQGDKLQGMDLLYLTTTGAKSGQRRTNPVARFEDGGGWLIVGSANGAATHPGWYHNIVAHPDQVEVEVAGQKHRVTVEQLDGEERERAWEKVVSRAPRFGGYIEKTDRALPVLRLTPTT